MVGRQGSLLIKLYHCLHIHLIWKSHFVGILANISKISSVGILSLIVPSTCSSMTFESQGEGEREKKKRKSVSDSGFFLTYELNPYMHTEGEREGQKF